MTYMCTKGQHAGSKFVTDRTNRHCRLHKLRKCGTGEVIYRTEEQLRESFRVIGRITARAFYKDIMGL